MLPGRVNRKRRRNLFVQSSSQYFLVLRWPLDQHVKEITKPNLAPHSSAYLCTDFISYRLSSSHSGPCDILFTLHPPSNYSPLKMSLRYHIRLWSGRPGFGRPGFGRPGSGRPGSGRPGSGRPGLESGILSANGKLSVQRWAAIWDEITS
jgi:hypothetical protein